MLFMYVHQLAVVLANTETKIVFICSSKTKTFFLAKRMREGTIHIPNLSQMRRSGDFGRLKNYVRSRIWLSIDDQDASLTRMEEASSNPPTAYHFICYKF